MRKSCKMIVYYNFLLTVTFNERKYNWFIEEYAGMNEASSVKCNIT